MTWAEPRPEVDASAAGAAAGAAAAAPGGGTSGGAFGTGGTGCGTTVGCVGTRIVPGTGVEPGGVASCVPGGGVGWPVGVAPGADAGDRGSDAFGVVAAGAAGAAAGCCG